LTFSWVTEVRELDRVGDVLAAFGCWLVCVFGQDEIFARFHLCRGAGMDRIAVLRISSGVDDIDQIAESLVVDAGCEVEAHRVAGVESTQFPCVAVA